jgi:hypothetical protein
VQAPFSMPDWVTMGMTQATPGNGWNAAVECQFSTANALYSIGDGSNANCGATDTTQTNDAMCWNAAAIGMLVASNEPADSKRVAF